MSAAVDQRPIPFRTKLASRLPANPTAAGHCNGGARASVRLKRAGLRRLCLRPFLRTGSAHCGTAVVQAAPAAGVATRKGGDFPFLVRSLKPAYALGLCRQFAARHPRRSQRRSATKVPRHGHLATVCALVDRCMQLLSRFRLGKMPWRCGHGLSIRNNGQVEDGGRGVCNLEASAKRR